ncbi:MAG: hypothetical protein ACTMHH_00600 [Nesterenkonia sp.]
MSPAEGHWAPLEALPLDEYEEIVVFDEWRTLRHHSSRSLTRTRALLDALGYEPHDTDHHILGVVGSKGKGTTAAYASACLAGVGHRVGTVMSPGTVSNADRIRIDGVAIDDTVRRRALQRIQCAREQLPEAAQDSGYLAPTGLFMVMAMLIFAEAGVDVVVAEAGIGGASDDLSHWRLDAVAVTAVFGEHLDLLGPTLADVAADKAAVITDDTQFCLSVAQSPEPAQVLRQRCAATGTPLIRPGERADQLASHLPPGLQRGNAALGIAAGMQLHQLGRGTRAAEPDEPRDSPQLATVLESVHYPGRMSVHTTAGGAGCVVDSAVSGAGLAAALEFARSQLTGVDQVLVCLPPNKDLGGFVNQLHDFDGRRVFVELPGAYTGMPDRADWPWEWVSQQALPDLLDAGNSLVVGTVLYTSLVLRTLGADADRLFTRP